MTKEVIVWFRDMDAARLLHHVLGQPELHRMMFEDIWNHKIDQLAAELRA